MSSQRIGSRKHRQRALDEELELLKTRLSRIEDEGFLLRNTIRGLARETDLGIGSACPRCDRAYMLVKNGMMKCPSCRHQISM